MYRATQSLNNPTVSTARYSSQRAAPTPETKARQKKG